MELVYILSAIIFFNLFTIYIVKNKFLIQFSLITSIIILFILIPQYLIQYGIIDKSFFTYLEEFAKK